MSDVNVFSRTQRIIVDPFSSAVALINAGPLGPTGVTGATGAPGTPAPPLYLEREWPPSGAELWAGLVWKIGSLGHEARWTGSAWQALNPSQPSLNACILISSMPLWYDSSAGLVGGVVPNRGSGGSAYDYTPNGGATTAVDVSGRTYLVTDGTDDYFSASDGTAWTFTTSDSFAMIMFVKPFTYPATAGALWGTRSATGGTGPGVHLTLGSAGTVGFRVADSSNGAGPTAVAIPTTSISRVVGWRDRSGSPIVNVSVNGVESTAVTDTTTATIDNSFASRVGRLASSGTGYVNIHVYAFGLLRRALTADDKLLLSDIALTRFS